MAVERAALRARGYDDEVVDIIQAARRPSTNRIYQSTWLAFCNWCTSQGVSPLSVPVPLILRFLRQGLSMGLAPNTLRRQVAALSTVLFCSNFHSLSEIPPLQLFLRGATNLSPPALHRFPSWDLALVLDSLTGAPYEPLVSATLEMLTQKVAFLVAITSARRVSELSALSIHKDLCLFLPDKVVLRPDPSFLPKINSTFHRSQELVLPVFHPRPRLPRDKVLHTLDVRRALKIYVDRTVQIRRSEALLVNFNSRLLGLKVSPSTISKWIRDTITRAYTLSGREPPLHVTAHSTRSAATSAAWRTKASLQEICRAAVWSSPSQFMRHYKVDPFDTGGPCLGLQVLRHATGAVG